MDNKALRKRTVIDDELIFLCKLHLKVDAGHYIRTNIIITARITQMSSIHLEEEDQYLISTALVIYYL